jgi:hypothetical protein
VRRADRPIVLARRPAMPTAVLRGYKPWSSCHSWPRRRLVLWPAAAAQSCGETALSVHRLEAGRKLTAMRPVTANSRGQPANLPNFAKLQCQHGRRRNSRSRSRSALCFAGSIDSTRLSSDPSECRSRADLGTRAYGVRPSLASSRLSCRPRTDSARPRFEHPVATTRRGDGRD